jgi:hypothetical protein
MGELRVLLNLAVDGQEWSASCLTTLLHGIETFMHWIY